MIKKLFTTLLVFFIIVKVSAQQLSPAQLFPGLFEAVQLSNIYPDNKTFVDATPKQNPAAILKAYNEQKNKPDFDLKQFVDAYFAAPGSGSRNFTSNVKAGIREHIDTLWQVLYRKHDTVSHGSSLLPLPHDFIVPGGRFREVYYWDSYFTMLGLQQSHKNELIKDMIGNFAYLIDTFGFIPNGNRTYYLTRSQPPFFSMMLLLLAKNEGDKVLVNYQPELLKEYAYWMSGASSLKNGEAFKTSVKMSDGELMNRYWDTSDQPREESYKKDVEAGKLTKQKLPDFYHNIRAAAASGWDFSSRWFDASGKLESIQTTNIIPVDLNCLLYNLEMVIAQSYNLQGNAAQKQFYQNQAEKRKKAILKYCWNEKAGWFLDYNWKQKQASPVETLAGVFPLAFKLASANQATLVSQKLQNKFLKPGGLVTTVSRSGQQWDAPNAWAPLQYMSILGLNNYQQEGLAQDIAQKWISINNRVFEQTGKLMEKYNVEDTNLKAGGGEYPLQDGFGWTNGVLLDLMNRYKTPIITP
jgi:alpha,alpha-trehalase